MFYSHPDRPLRDHATDVTDRALTAFEQSMPADPPDRSPQLKEWLRLILVCHDFGKYTTFFDRHLHGENVGEERYHAELGAMFASYVAEQTIALNASPQDLDYFSSIIIYYVIHRHHGHLVNLERVFQRADQDWSQPKILFKASFKLQIADLKSQAAAIEADISLYAADLAPLVSPFLEEWESHAKVLMRKRRQLSRRLEDIDSRPFAESVLWLGITIQHFFSLLIDSDKQSAAQLAPILRKELSPERIERYKRNILLPSQTSSDGNIADKRNLIHDIVIERVKQTDLRQSFHTFTAPTGAGKTLTALEGALLLRKRLMADGSAPRRIIYVLPFTSIIDQNHQVIEKVFCPDEPDHSLVLKHHYLSEIEYRSGELQQEMSLDKQLMYIESWESEIIVTTYVQLMQTLLGVKNGQLKKWHRLRGAIIILDEVQNIPFAYWKLTREICREHSRLFDTKWILLTATQPHIFPKEETYEWLENDAYANRTFFQNMTRTSLHMVSTEFLEIEDWLEQADKLVAGVKSVLIIMNTIRSSLEVYRFFRKKYGEDEVFYLSANLIPRHRRIVLQKIRERLSDSKGKRVILVSTQVVEAGVDLDFHRVIRDLGPLDAIIQAAGRCNRHDERGTEQVFIIPLRKRSGASPDSVLVYGTDAICALKVLKTVSSQNPDGIPESRYAELIDLYYREIANMNDDSESTNRLTQLAELSFDALADFNLIRQEVSKHPVFVQFDEEAEELWRFYCEQVVEEEDPAVRRENYLRCKARLKEYQVDISERTLRYHRALQEENGMIVVRREWVELGQYYDQNIGMIIDPTDENAFMM